MGGNPKVVKVEGVCLQGWVGIDEVGRTKANLNSVPSSGLDIQVGVDGGGGESDV